MLLEWSDAANLISAYVHPMKVPAAIMRVEVIRQGQSIQPSKANDVEQLFMQGISSLQAGQLGHQWA